MGVMGEQSKRKGRFHLEVENESTALESVTGQFHQHSPLWTKLTFFSPSASKFLLHITSLPLPAS